MCKFVLIALTLLLTAVARPAFASDAEQIFNDTIAALQSANLTIFGEATRRKISTAQSPRQALLAAGRLRVIELIGETALPSGLVIEGRTRHAKQTILWTVTYSTRTQLVDIAAFAPERVTAQAVKKKAKKAKRRTKNGEPPVRDVAAPARDLPSTTRPLGRGPASIITSRQPTTGRPQHDPLILGSPSTLPVTPPGAANDDLEVVPAPLRPLSSTIDLSTPLVPHRACAQYPDLCVSRDAQTVEFLFATTRKQAATRKVAFSGERHPGLTFGAARVRIPTDRVPGEIKLPKQIGLWGYTLWEEKTDESRHFVIKSIVKLDETVWGDFITQKKSNEALVFVHGFNNSFEDALYRHAQIIWDLQYTRGMSVLFSWASNAKTLDYVYDRDSALDAREPFIEVLRKLKTVYGIEKIHVLAHSMGNFVVLESLANQARTADPLTIAEIIMAAPDVDRNHYLRIAPVVRKIANGMTLYASSADKALLASKSVAGSIPRAGDVPKLGGPIILPDIDTIDVTELGDEFLGLNHDVFAKSPTVMADIKALIASSMRPPGMRSLPTVRVLPAPDGVNPSTYWRYVPLPAARPDTPRPQSR